eukprot:COSAG01_NODE_21250_length_911_cov_0.671182_2_plen_78_part_01
MAHDVSNIAGVAVAESARRIEAAEHLEHGGDVGDLLIGEVCHSDRGAGRHIRSGAPRSEVSQGPGKLLQIVSICTDTV